MSEGAEWDGAVRIELVLAPFPAYHCDWITAVPQAGSLRRRGDRWVFDAFDVNANRTVTIDLYEFLHCKPIKDEVIER